MRHTAIFFVLALALARADTPANQGITIMMTGDGFTDEKHGEFDAVCDSFEKGLFEVEPYSKLKPFYKFKRVWQPSKDYGCAREGVAMPDTQLNFSLYRDRHPDVRKYEDPHFKFPEECKTPQGTPMLLFFDKWDKETVFGIKLKPRGSPGFLYSGKSWDEANPSPLEGSMTIPGCPPREGEPGGLKWLESVVQDNGGATVAVIVTPDTDVHAGLTAYKCGDKDHPFNTVLMTAAEAKKARDMYVTLAHELGHAVYNLDDEYTHPGERCAKPANDITPDPANIVLDKTKPKWAHLVELGIIKNDPVPGGSGGCASEVFHPTPTCIMNDGGKEFCPVCNERIAHAQMERMSMIVDSSPIHKIVTDPDQRFHFTVQTRGTEDPTQCPNRYVGYWELDGKRYDGTKKSAGGGLEFALTLEAGVMTLGTHRLRFVLGDGQVYCDHPPQSDGGGARPAMPWDTVDWWMYMVPRLLTDPLHLRSLLPEKHWD